MQPSFLRYAFQDGIHACHGVVFQLILFAVISSPLGISPASRVRSRCVPTKRPRLRGIQRRGTCPCFGWFYFLLLFLL